MTDEGLDSFRVGELVAVIASFGFTQTRGALANVKLRVICWDFSKIPSSILRHTTMKRVIIVVLALLLVCGMVPTAVEAQEAAITFNCASADSCTDYSVGEVRHFWHSLVTECLGGRACLGFDIATHDDPCFGDNLWAPIHDVAGGAQALQTVKELVQSGHPVTKRYGPNAVAHFQYVLLSNNVLGEQHFAKCEVKLVDGVLGPPRDCRLVALMAGGDAWLRLRRASVREGREPSCFLSAGYRASGAALNLEFSMLTDKSIHAVGAAVLRMLRDELKFSAVLEEQRSRTDELISVRIRATAAMRDSMVLTNGWRDAMDFDVTLRPGGTKSNQQWIKVDGVAFATVCRYALGTLTAYHLPDDAQRKMYAEALDLRLENALKSVCTKSDKT